MVSFPQIKTMEVKLREAMAEPDPTIFKDVAQEQQSIGLLGRGHKEKPDT